MAELHYRDMDVEELAGWIKEKRDFTLLDVRLESEVDRAAIPFAVHIPMKDLQARVREIPKGKPVVVMCHHGDRSTRIAQFLVTDGFLEVFNLDGGIDAYALRVDHSVGRY
jgi:rhodanese-related sulfurtransferase